MYLILGHGGKSPGAVNGNIVEKDVNLIIAKEIKKQLEEYKNVEVTLTHEGLDENKELDIFDRSMIARNEKADLLVSLHINSYETGAQDGAEVYVTNNTSLKKYKEDTTILGNKILANLEKLGIKNNGVKTRLIPNDETDVYSDGTRADYYGIIRYAMRGTKIDFGEVKPENAISAIVEKGEGIPTILVEHCYIKGKDVVYIDNDEKIKKIAKADADAIIEHYELKKEEIEEKVVELKEDNIFITPDTNIEAVRTVYADAKIDGEIVTNSIVKIKEQQYKIVKLGDCNGDGEADAIDLLLIKRHLLGTHKLDGNYKLAVDLNGDNVVDAIDLLLQKRHLLGTQKIKL